MTFILACDIREHKINLKGVIMTDALDKFHDECAIAGVYGNHEAAKLVYLCLYALQHRGQQGTGIAAYDGEHIHSEKREGLVADVYTKKRLKKLTGKIAIGHNR